MTYVREQTSAELAAHMRSLKKMPGWFEPLADRLWQEVEILKAENERLHKLVSWQSGASNEVTISAGQLMKHMDERDQLKAENEALRREREGKVLCDLELFETLRDAANTEADEHRQCMATYRPLRQANLDSVVKKCDDLLAAMGKGEQS